MIKINRYKLEKHELGIIVYDTLTKDYLNDKEILNRLNTYEETSNHYLEEIVSKDTEIQMLKNSIDTINDSNEFTIQIQNDLYSKEIETIKESHYQLALQSLTYQNQLFLENLRLKSLLEVKLK